MFLPIFNNCMCKICQNIIRNCISSSYVYIPWNVSVAFKVPVIRDYGSFFQDNPYNPGLPIALHNPTLTRMPTSPSTYRIPSHTRFLARFFLLIPCLRVYLPTVPPIIQPHTSEHPRGRPCSPDAVAMTTASGGIAAAVATSPDAVVVGTDADYQLAKSGLRGQCCNNAARPGGRHGLPERPGRRRDETGLGGRRRCRRGCAVRP